MSSAGPPLIIMRHCVDFPSKQAYAVQMAMAAYGLADAGAEVWMSVGKITVDSPEQAWSTFGLDPHPRVKLLEWSRNPRGLRDWKGWLFRCVIRAKLRKYRRRRPVFYVLDKGVNFETILELAKVRKAINARIMLESHAHQADYLLERLDKAESEEAREEIRRGKWGKIAADESQAVRAVDLFVAVSEQLRERMCTAAERKGPSAVFRNGAITSPVPDVPLAEREGVVYVGHPFTIKGVDDLIAAMAQVPDTPLKIVGCRDDEEKEKVMGWAHDHGVADRVTITGFVPMMQVFEHLSRARVAVIPQKWGDGSPMKAFDYMTSGCPIVATRVPANIEIIEESGAGVLVPPQDPAAMAAQLRVLLNDDALAEKYRRSGMAWISQNTWKKRGERMLSLLESLESA